MQDMQGTIIAMAVVAAVLLLGAGLLCLRPSYEQREAQELLSQITQYLRSREGQWVELSELTQAFRLDIDSATDAVRQLARELPGSIRQGPGGVMLSGFIPDQRQPGSHVPRQTCKEQP
ncbi:MAG TPA: hypothetical protein VLI05_06895 [Candidatus Saccharimonadia bacterium]|nr:hypothetical protein [Candidatus Saccharimonadia bacterium]